MLREEAEIKPDFKAAGFEKRSHPRFVTALPIEYGRIDSPENRSGHTSNISESGAMISLPEQIEVGTNLRVKIFFSLGRELNTIEATGTVVWTNIDLERKGYYRIGLKYEDISPENVQRLRSLLNRFGDRW